MRARRPREWPRGCWPSSAAVRYNPILSDTGGQLTGYTSAKEVLAAINDAPDIDSKKKSLTSTGRRANSSQGKAVERGRQAIAIRQQATAFMTAAAMGAAQTPAGPGRGPFGGLPPMTPEMMQQQLAGLMGQAAAGMPAAHAQAPATE